MICHHVAFSCELFYANRYVDLALPIKSNNYSRIVSDLFFSNHRSGRSNQVSVVVLSKDMYANANILALQDCIDYYSASIYNESV